MHTWAQRSYPCHLFVEEAWRVRNNTSCRASVSLSRHANISTGILNTSRFPGKQLVLYIMYDVWYHGRRRISTYMVMESKWRPLIDVKPSSFYTHMLQSTTSANKTHEWNYILYFCIGSSVHMRHSDDITRLQHQKTPTSACRASHHSPRTLLGWETWAQGKHVSDRLLLSKTFIPPSPCCVNCRTEQCSHMATSQFCEHDEYNHWRVFVVFNGDLGLLPPETVCVEFVIIANWGNNVGNWETEESCGFSDVRTWCYLAASSHLLLDGLTLERGLWTCDGFLVFSHIPNSSNPVFWVAKHNRLQHKNWHIAYSDLFLTPSRLGVTYSPFSSWQVHGFNGWRDTVDISLFHFVVAHRWFTVSSFIWVLKTGCFFVDLLR